jgi:hypothetical protein
MFEFTRYDEAECTTVFDRLFPYGFSGRDVRDEIAPDGWPQSPLISVFHPCAAQFQPSPIETEREVRELVGMCVWDVFSDGHEVVHADGRVVDLGSFRASGGFIADWLNRRIGWHEYDYLNFYLGTIWISQRADLTSIFRMIFGRLKKQQFDWIYHFPRLHLVDLRPLKEHLNRSEEPEWVDYDPSGAIAEQQEEMERQQRLAEMRACLDEAHREAVEAARDAPPPTTVAAYRSIYNRFPRGWPPECSP